MKDFRVREFATYPRRFIAYRWYKPILVGLLAAVFYLLFAAIVYLITYLVFGTGVSASGYGQITAQTTVPSMLWNAGLQLLFLLFVIYADKKLHWFDEVRRDDIEAFDAGYLARKRRSSSK